VLIIIALILATNPTATHSMAKAALHGGERPLTADKAEGKVQEDTSSKA